MSLFGNSANKAPGLSINTGAANLLYVIAETHMGGPGRTDARNEVVLLPRIHHNRASHKPAILCLQAPRRRRNRACSRATLQPQLRQVLFLAQGRIQRARAQVSFQTQRLQTRPPKQVLYSEALQQISRQEVDFLEITRQRPHSRQAAVYSAQRQQRVSQLQEADYSEAQWVHSQQPAVASLVQNRQPRKAHLCLAGIQEEEVFLVHRPNRSLHKPRVCSDSSLLSRLQVYLGSLPLLRRQTRLVLRSLAMHPPSLLDRL